jgi:hypothetical protein
MPGVLTQMPSRPFRLLLGLSLLLAACSAASPTPTATPEPTASPTPSPTPEPTASPSPSGGLGISQAATDYLVPLDGIDYVELDATVENQMLVSFGQTPGMAEAIDGYAVRGVGSATNPKAVFLVLELAPSLSNNAAAMGGFWGGVAGSLGIDDTQKPIAGRKVHVLDSASVAMIGWQDGDLVVLIIGQKLADVRPAAEALITAHA